MSSAILTPRKKALFLAELAKTANASRAARVAGFKREQFYQWRQSDPAFKAEWDAALSDYAENILEPEADRRAVEGTRKKKFLKDGSPVIDPETGNQYEEREFSDTLLIFRLKGLKPDMYADRQKTDLTGNVTLVMGE